MTNHLVRNRNRHDNVDGHGSQETWCTCTIPNCIQVNKTEPKAKNCEDAEKPFGQCDIWIGQDEEESEDEEW